MAATGSGLIQGSSSLLSMSYGDDPVVLPISSSSYLTNITVSGNTFRFASSGQQILSIMMKPVGGTAQVRYTLQVYNNTNHTVDASYVLDAGGGPAAPELHTIQLVLDVASTLYTYSLRVTVNTPSGNPSIVFNGTVFSMIVTTLANSGGGGGGVTGSGSSPLFARWSSSSNLTDVGVSPTTTVSNAEGVIGTSATNSKALVLQGMAGQTANVFETQNSAGVVTFAVPSPPNMNGAANTVAGDGAGFNITDGASNSIYGQSAASTLTTGISNCIFGTSANVDAADTLGAVVVGQSSKGATLSTIIGNNKQSSVTNDLIVASGDTGIARNAAAGVLRVTDGSTGIGSILSKLVISAKTANYPITANESLSVFTNAGAAGAVTFTLNATPANGTTFFFNVVAAQNLIIKTGTTVLIYLGTIPTTATTGNITSNAVGSYIMLTYNGSFWAGIPSGTWTPT